MLIVDLPQVYFVHQKKIGKGKIRKAVSARLITDDEIDLGQVYVDSYKRLEAIEISYCGQTNLALQEAFSKHPAPQQ